MKDFIEKIEKIGFEEIRNRRYKYGLWRIDINEGCWHLTYSDGNPDPLKRVEVTHGFIPFDGKDTQEVFRFGAERDKPCEIRNRMRVYCIKTKYNKNDRYGLNESVEYVLFKKGHFYECDENVSGIGIVVMNRDGLRFAFDSNHFATEEDWRESRLNDLGI